MGNAGSGHAGGGGGQGAHSRHQAKTTLTEPPPSSPNSAQSQPFTFDRKTGEKKALIHQGSQEDDAPVFTKNIRDGTYDDSTSEISRRRANTVSSTTQLSGSTGSGGSGDSTGLNSSVTPTVFRWEGGGKEVYVSGTFSEWKTIPMVQSHGNFVTIVDLPEGEHHYKFYVDGEWRNDPDTQVVESTIGSKNNKISVRKSDFEVFQALDKDSESTAHDVAKDYAQEIPSSKPWEKQTGPPILPPHLLQVILNKDTPLQCEPTLLPEPNHVMLNHLYALSIKDGVMVLSATHRYRKKYVTTLLYKPI